MFADVFLLHARTLRSLESPRSDTWSVPRRLDTYSDPVAEVTISGLHYLLQSLFLPQCGDQTHKPDSTPPQFSKKSSLIIYPEILHVGC